MSKSIVESDWGEFPFDQPQCFICGCETNLEKHHIFAGHANRKISEREGFGSPSVLNVTAVQRAPSTIRKSVTT